MLTQEYKTIIRTNWLRASQELGFKIISPFSLSTGGTKEIFALLPEYGSPNGALVELIHAPNYEADQHLIEWARLNNCFYSFINADQSLEYNQAYFKEILEDWGYYG